MNIVIFGAGGTGGRAVVAEASSRGHAVTAVVRDPAKHADLAGVGLLAGDVTDPASVAAAAAGQDVAISSIYDPAHPADFYSRAANALVAGLAKAHVNRLLSVGLSVLLETAPGVRLLDGPEFPNEHKPFCESHAAGAEVFRRADDLDWLIISPIGDFDRDKGRTGEYGLATMPDMADKISYADLAVAMLDEIDNPKHHRMHIGVSSHS
jgi:putative NADH-flavin reductase